MRMHVSKFLADMYSTLLLSPQSRVLPLDGFMYLFVGSLDCGTTYAVAKSSTEPMTLGPEFKFIAPLQQLVWLWE